MSADNYLWVRKWRGQWFVQQEFASVPTDGRRKPVGLFWGPFSDESIAIMAALLEENIHYYEYGVSLGPLR